MRRNRERAGPIWLDLIAAEAATENPLCGPLRQPPQRRVDSLLSSGRHRTQEVHQTGARAHCSAMENVGGRSVRLPKDRPLAARFHMLHIIGLAHWTISGRKLREVGLFGLSVFR